MRQYRSLDGFMQPRETPPTFARFIQAQHSANWDPAYATGASVYAATTLAGTKVPAVVYPNTRVGEVTVRYDYYGPTDLSQLHMRTHKTGTKEGPTDLYTRYVVSGASDGGLLVAHEVNGDFDDDGNEASGNQQALASALGEKLFSRGLVATESSHEAPQIWGLVGAAEVEALGRFLVDGALAAV